MKDQESIKRIREMEQLLDEVSAAVMNLTILLENQEEVRRKVDRLAAYYESEDWKQDYADEEAGKFPSDLKRGILSEDGIWNVLTRWRELDSQLLSITEEHEG